MKLYTQNYVSNLDYKIIGKYFLNLTNQVLNAAKQNVLQFFLPSFTKYQHVLSSFKSSFSKLTKFN
jgi:hypothetical protein